MIIKKDTIWRAGERISINDRVQVASGATLTIEAGARIEGGEIQVYGSLKVSGTKSKSVAFDDVRVTFGTSYENPGKIDISHARFNGGEFFPATGNASYGSFNVSHSTFDGVGGFYIWYPGDSAFVRNTFLNSQGLSIGTSENLLVRNNSFVDPMRPYNGSQDAAIVVWADYGKGISIHNNTFSLSNETVAIELPMSYAISGLNARENYFGTDKVSGIKKLILDGDDDLERGGTVSIKGFLSAPHPNSPEVPLTINGSAKNDVLFGGKKSDTINGSSGDDLLDGGYGHDYLKGGSGNDKLYGAGGRDLLQGGSGADKLYGGAGADTFKFVSVKDSIPKSSYRDKIYDFSRSQKDKIDLRLIDADTELRGNQAFEFIGKKGFTGDGGEIRYYRSKGDTYIVADVNGDKKSDLSLALNNSLDIKVDDFLL